MTLKNAALLALIGTILMTALLLQSFVLTFLNVLRGLVPAVTLFQSFIYAVACFRVAAFLPVLQRAVAVIPAKVLFPTNGCGAGDRKGRRSAGTLAAGRGWSRLTRFRGGGGLLCQV